MSTLLFVMLLYMNALEPGAQQWLAEIIGLPFTARKHIHSHQDEVYKIVTASRNYYLKIAKSLKAERDNLKKLDKILNVPRTLGLYHAAGQDYLLISELPGKNLVELIGAWPSPAIVDMFAKAIRQLHKIDATKIFPEATADDVLLHGDIALPNIIISDQGAIGYIDFGQLSFGTPDLDLADAIWSLQRNIGSDYGELFLEKYGSVTMTPKIQKALKFRYQPTENK